MHSLREGRLDGARLAKGRRPTPQGMARTEHVFSGSPLRRNGAQQANARNYLSCGRLVSSKDVRTATACALEPIVMKTTS